MKTQYIYSGPGTRVDGIGNLLAGDTFAVDDSHPFVQDNPYVMITSQGKVALRASMGLAGSSNNAFPSSSLVALFRFFETGNSARMNRVGNTTIGFTPAGGPVEGYVPSARGIIDGKHPVNQSQWQGEGGVCLRSSTKSRLVNHGTKLNLGAIAQSAGSFTIAFWWKQDDFGGVQADCPFSQYTGPNTASCFAVIRNPSTGVMQVRVVCNDGEEVIINATEYMSGMRPVPAKVGAWTHYVITYGEYNVDDEEDDGLGISIFIDGKYRSKGYLPEGKTINFNATAQEMIGASRGGATSDLCSDGIISQLAVWSRYLTTDEVKSLANDGFGILSV